jgi:transmembrane sensor
MKRASDIEEEAAKWLVQLDSQGSPERWAALDAWLNANPRHRAAFLRLSVAWTRSDNLRRLRPLDPHVDPDLLSRNARRRRERPAWLRPIWVLGTTAAAIGIVALGLSLWKGSEVRDSDIYASQIDEPAKEIILQDGSSVVLNTDSEVRVKFTPSHRQVTLLRGEALFKVSHNAERPFDVVAGRATVRAVGTAFSVRVLDRSRVDVLVTDGRVALNPPSGETLDKGEAARLVGESVHRRRVESSEIASKLAWIEGRVVFRGETLNEVAAEFNRYNRRRMVIPDPVVGTRRVNGRFSALEPEAFLEAIGPTLKVRGRVSDSFFGPEVIRLEANDGESIPRSD